MKFGFLVILSLTAVFNTALANGNDICGHLNEIKLIPFKGEHVDDDIYNSLLEMGRKAIPCLIEEITNEQPMLDPRKMPPYDNFRVGDLAFFIIVKIAKKPLSDFLPAKIREKYKNEGVYAYFEYVNAKGNRSNLQNKLKNWYASY